MLRPNWFEQESLGEFSAKGQFEKFLTPMMQTRGLRFIQIGVFAGDASLWLCQNALGVDDHLDDVDTWEGDYQGSDQRQIEAIYDQRMIGYSHKVSKFKMTSAEYFASPDVPAADFIYIDGDHNATSVLEDAVRAWPNLKRGGIMAFDDYSDLGEEHEHPHVAIEAFLAVYGSKVEILSRALQVWVRKR